MASLMQRFNSEVYYIQYYVSGKLKRVSTGTTSEQIAKEKFKRFKAAQARGDRLPTRTPIADVLTAYVADIRTRKSPKGVQNDVYYLRDAFGPVCEAVRVNSRKVSEKVKRRPPKPGQDRRRNPQPTDEGLGRNLGLARPAVDEVDDLIAGVVGGPLALQVWPRLFLTPRARPSARPGLRFSAGAWPPGTG